MLRSVQLLRNCTKLQSTLKGIPTIVRRGVGSDSSLLEFFSHSQTYRLPLSLTTATDYVKLRSSTKLSRSITKLLTNEYDTFNKYAIQKYDNLSESEQDQLDSLIKGMVQKFADGDFIGVLNGYRSIDVPVNQYVHQLAFSCLFHMDLIPQLPQSVLYQLLVYIKMNENMIPVDLSAMNKQIESYIPLTTRIDDGRNFKSIMLKFILLSTILALILHNHRKNSNNASNQIYVPEKNIKTRFSDVIGLGESTEELKLMVEYLKNPQKFSFIGAKSPRGVLFTGPPGTGKTMLARAVAGEAGVPFFFVAGSEFDEVFVGVGAKRVRALFQQARKNAPCIVFIDELDAVGGKRDEIGGSNNSRQTINQLLNEIGGFRGDEGILVIAATNLKDSLDPALIRAGRFDLEVKTSLPDYESRLKILQLKAKTHRLSPQVDLEYLAKITVGHNGADLETLLNVATMKALAEGSPFITQHHLEESRERLTMGIRKPKVEDEQVNYATAVHECGHALMSLLTPNYPKVDKITIIPRGEALGYVSNVMDEKFLYSTSKKDILNRIDVALAGRIAEEIMLGENKISTGASNDLQKVTQYVYQMVYAWGMTECGFRADPSNNSPYSTALPFYSQYTIDKNDEIINSILKERYEYVKSVLIANKSKLRKLIKYVLEKETVTGENALRIIEGKKPIEKEEDEESVMKEKELSNAYFILSLVDNYSLRDGQIIDRNMNEEHEYFAMKSIDNMSKEIDDISKEKNEESIEKLQKKVNHLKEFKKGDTVKIIDKYSKLLYQHSLDTVNVEEVLETVKKESEEESSKG